MEKYSKFVFLLLLFLLFSFGIYAQNLNKPSVQPLNSEVSCGTEILHNDLLKNNEAFRKQITQNEKLIREALESKANARTNSGNGQVLLIPVVVHIIHTGEAVGIGNNISDAQIHSAITGLNDMYRKKPGTFGDGDGADTEIEFRLATRDPACNPTTGIVRVNGSTVPNYASYGVKLSGLGAEDLAIKNLSRWPNTDYYNIWVVSEIDNNNGGAGVQGYAYLPGAPADIDGTVILNSAFGTTGTVKYYTNRGKTLAHELAHGLSLYHTFEGDNNGTTCPVSGNGCGSGQGDCIADTEPHIRTASNCPVGTYNSCTNTTIGSVYKNYMDYSSQNCANEFTFNQKERLRTAITELRPGLINTQSLTTGTLTLPVAANCSPTSSVSNNNYGIGIYKFSIGNNAVASSGTVNDNALLVDRSCSQQFSQETGSAFQISVNTGNANNENVHVYLDYNNNGNFTDPGELVLTSANAKTHGTTVTPPAEIVENTALRLRVISDFTANTITGPCYQPQYGQIEDYAVLFISPLPVSLEMFTARKDQEYIRLHWKTAQEKNNQYFEIERSGNANEWQAIGKLKGAGNSAVSLAYTFTDSKPKAGSNYYRLKQVDSDGRFVYSQIRHVAYTDEQSSFTLYPNPGHGQFILKANGLPEDPLHLRVFDTKGQAIYEQRALPEPEISLSLQNHPAGLYLLEISNKNETTRLKLFKE